MSHQSNATDVGRNAVDKEKGDKSESLKRSSSELNDKEETKLKLQKTDKGGFQRTEKENGQSKHKEEEDEGEDSKDEDDDDVGAEGEGDDFDEEEGDEDAGEDEGEDEEDEDA